MDAKKRPTLAPRFFKMGDGTLKIRSTKNRHRFVGRYRRKDGRYRTSAVKKICRVIGAPYDDTTARVALRFIEGLSLIRKLAAESIAAKTRKRGLQTRGKTLAKKKRPTPWIIVSSGYRSPKYNEGLRAKGRTVAKASMHQYGMAADFRITGIKTKTVWALAKAAKIGGAGYYNSPWMHLDVGPVRDWRQGTANVRKGVSDNNKVLILVPQYDRYRAGETSVWRFVRMTAYPIGIRPRFELLKRQADGSFQPASPNVSSDPMSKRSNRTSMLRPRFVGKRTRARCPRFKDMPALTDIKISLPKTLAKGRYKLRVRFCRRLWKEMPKSIDSYTFEIR
jgi:hypothetical protein